MTATSEEMQSVKRARRGFRGWIAKKKTFSFQSLEWERNEVDGLASIAGDTSSPSRRAVHWEVRPPRTTHFIFIAQANWQILLALRVSRSELGSFFRHSGVAVLSRIIVGARAFFSTGCG
jgi:hypothetical protein